MTLDTCGSPTGRTLLALALCVWPLIAEAQDDAAPEPGVIDLVVDCAKETGRFEHFWAAAGSPRLGQPEEYQVYSYLDSIPHQGVRIIRIQHVLDRLGAVNPNGEYDWSAAIDLVHYLVDHDLEPFFCLNGFPGGKQLNFENLDDVREWHAVVLSFVTALQDEFGAGRVRQWWFELWNEPDISDVFDESMPAMLNCYDATVTAVKEADPRIRFAAPDTAKVANMFREFFVHLDSGVNALTGQKVIQPDCISYHVKGRALQKGSIDRMVELELQGYARSQEKYEAARHLPIRLTECDLVGDAQRPLEWRATSEYPAQFCRLLSANVQLVHTGQLPLALQIADNAKAQDFQQRRMLARFLDEQSGRFELVKKPIFNLMTMLSLLGEEALEIGCRGNEEPGFGAIATKYNDSQIAVLLFNSPEELTEEPPTSANKYVRGQKEHGGVSVNLKFKNIPFSSSVSVHYRIDHEHGNPYEVWINAGAPEQPDAELLQQMRKVQELALYGPPQTLVRSDDPVGLRFDLPAGNVSLVLIAKRPHKKPAQVRNVRVESYQGLHDSEDNLILWDGVPSRNIETYEVLYSSAKQGTYQRINAADLVDTAFLHDKATTAGYYRVRAVDYWGREGTCSKAVHFDQPALDESRSS